MNLVLHSVSSKSSAQIELDKRKKLHVLPLSPPLRPAKEFLLRDCVISQQAAG